MFEFVFHGCDRSRATNVLVTQKSIIAILLIYCHYHLDMTQGTT